MNIEGRQFFYYKSIGIYNFYHLENHFYVNVQSHLFCLYLLLQVIVHIFITHSIKLYLFTAITLVQLKYLTTRLGQSKK